MPPTTKIIVQEDGQPSVTLLIDPAEPPVSLGALLDRARKFREEAAGKSEADRGYTYTPHVPHRPPSGFEVMGQGATAVQDAMNLAVVREVSDRLKRVAPHEAVDLLANERAAVAAALELVLTPQFLVEPGAYSEDEMAEMLKAGPGHLTFVPDPESDLEDVLDSYRLAGRLCGVQVFSVDHVVCWIGDIEQAQGYARLRLRGPGTASPMFYTTSGANALEYAAKWLREMLG